PIPQPSTLYSSRESSIVQLIASVSPRRSWPGPAGGERVPVYGAGALAPSGPTRCPPPARHGTRAPPPAEGLRWIRTGAARQGHDRCRDPGGPPERREPTGIRYRWARSVRSGPSLDTRKRPEWSAGIIVSRAWPRFGCGRRPHDPGADDVRDVEL